MISEYDVRRCRAAELIVAHLRRAETDALFGVPVAGGISI
jgi:hypothetical protein